jgi:hypothetical protein
VLRVSLAGRLAISMQAGAESHHKSSMEVLAIIGKTHAESLKREGEFAALT